MTPAHKTQGCAELVCSNSFRSDDAASNAVGLLHAELRKAGRTPFKITITDLSRTGCRADTLAKTYPGDTMYVSLPGLAPIAGVIRWATSRGFGIEWTAPLHPSVFDHIRARYPNMFR